MTTQDLLDAESLSPEVAKRLLRNLLREERERANLTQTQAAERVIWSLSKLIRIETGVVPAAPADVRLLLLEYGTDPERLAKIVDIATAARKPDIWSPYKKDIGPEYFLFLASEQSASAILKYEPSAVPGLLQTEDYARALSRDVGMAPDKVDQTWEIRSKRQEMLSRDDCPELHIIMGEASVSRPVGGTGTMRKQLEHIKDLARHPKVFIQFLPFAAGPHVGMGEAFQLVQFSNPRIPDLCFLEGAQKDSIVRDDVADVDRYGKRFMTLRELADDAGDFNGLDEIAAFQFGRAHLWQAKHAKDRQPA